MCFDYWVTVSNDFPNPAKQAQALLEISDENIQAARSLVWARIRFATNVDEIRYWCQVHRLLSQPEHSVNANGPSDGEGER